MELVKEQANYCKSSEIPEELGLQLLEHAASIDKDTVKSPHQQLCISLPWYTKEDLTRLQKLRTRILPSWWNSWSKATGQQLRSVQKRRNIQEIGINILFSRWHFVQENCFVWWRNSPVCSSLVFEKVYLKHLHDLVGHQCSERTLSLNKSRCYWPTMIRDVESWVKKCERCFISKEPHIKLKSKMCHLSASRSLDTIVDFIILKKSSSGFENALSVTDMFFEFTHAHCTKDQKASTVASYLQCSKGMVP